MNIKESLTCPKCKKRKMDSKYSNSCKICKLENHLKDILLGRDVLIDYLKNRILNPKEDKDYVENAKKTTQE